jgi:hypothetical protein
MAALVKPIRGQKSSACGKVLKHYLYPNNYSFSPPESDASSCGSTSDSGSLVSFSGSGSSVSTLPSSVGSSVGGTPPGSGRAESGSSSGTGSGSTTGPGSLGIPTVHTRLIF